MTRRNHHQHTSNHHLQCLTLYIASVYTSRHIIIPCLDQHCLTSQRCVSNCIKIIRFYPINYFTSSVSSLKHWKIMALCPKWVSVFTAFVVSARHCVLVIWAGWLLKMETNHLYPPINTCAHQTVPPDRLTPTATIRERIEPKTKMRLLIKKNKIQSNRKQQSALLTHPPTYVFTWTTRHTLIHHNYSMIQSPCTFPNVYCQLSQPHPVPT